MRNCSVSEDLKFPLGAISGRFVWEFDSTCMECIAGRRNDDRNKRQNAFKLGIRISPNFGLGLLIINPLFLPNNNCALSLLR